MLKYSLINFQKFYIADLNLFAFFFALYIHFLGHGWDSYSWDELKQFATLSSKIANGITSEAKHDFPVLFGPLLELVKESPEAVLNFLNNP